MSISLIITILLITIIICGLIYFKYSISKNNFYKKEDKEKEDNKKEDKEKENKEKIKNDMLNKIQDTVKTQKLLNDVLKDDIKIAADKIYYEPFTLTFTYDYELLSVSDSFLKLKDVSSFEELKRKYKIIKVVRETNNNNDVNLLLNVLNESDKKYKITFNDVFDVSQKELNEIDNAINNIENANENKDIIYHSKIALNVDSNDIQVRTIVDIKNNHKEKKFKVIFRIYKLAPKVSTLIDNTFSGSRYKDLIQDVIINLSFPLFIINKAGIRFLNKCACDWFEVPYHRIDNIGNGVQLMEEIFNKIDPTIIDKFMESLNSDNQTTVYIETLYNINGSNTIMSDSGIRFIPKEIIVQGREFNVAGIDNLFVTITEATSLHSYIIKHKDFIKDDSINNANELQQLKSNEVIDHLTQINNLYKDLFKNTAALSFARIDINTRNIIICNNLFESNISSDLKGARYLLIINYLIQRYNFDENNNINYYSYDIMYKDLTLNIRYTYGKDYIDLFILDKDPTNNNIETLGDLQNTSELSIVTVDKNGKILLSNDIFKKQYLKQNNESDNLIDIIIDNNDKNKFKKSLTDSIKFNSCNISDIITVIDKDNKKIKINCIKRYNEINNNQLITITFFPIKDAEKEIIKDVIADTPTKNIIIKDTITKKTTSKSTTSKKTASKTSIKNTTKSTTKGTSSKKSKRGE